MGLARAGDLSSGVHCERAGTLEPELVARSLEEGEECVAVACCAVTETGSAGERAGAPGQLAACVEAAGRARRRPARTGPARRRSPGRRDTTGRGSGRRALAGRCPSAGANSPARPPRPRSDAPPRQRARRGPPRSRTPRARACTPQSRARGRGSCAGLPTITCVQTPDSGSRSSSSHAALSRQRSAQRASPVERCSSAATSMVPALPHISSRCSSFALAAISSARRSAFALEGAIRWRTRRIPASPKCRPNWWSSLG